MCTAWFIKHIFFIYIVSCFWLYYYPFFFGENATSERERNLQIFVSFCFSFPFLFRCIGHCYSKSFLLELNISYILGCIQKQESSLFIQIINKAIMPSTVFEMTMDGQASVDMAFVDPLKCRRLSCNFLHCAHNSGIFSRSPFWLVRFHF